MNCIYDQMFPGCAIDYSAFSTVQTCASTTSRSRAVPGRGVRPGHDRRHARRHDRGPGSGSGMIGVGWGSGSGMIGVGLGSGSGMIGVGWGSGSGAVRRRVPRSRLQPRRTRRASRQQHDAVDGRQIIPPTVTPICRCSRRSTIAELKAAWDALCVEAAVCAGGGLGSGSGVGGEWIMPTPPQTSDGGMIGVGSGSGSGSGDRLNNCACEDGSVPGSGGCAPALKAYHLVLRGGSYLSYLDRTHAPAARAGGLGPTGSTSGSGSGSGSGDGDMDSTRCAPGCRPTAR